MTNPDPEILKRLTEAAQQRANGRTDQGFDLNLLRDMTDEAREKIHAIAKSKFREQGMVCHCGELITCTGITAYLYTEMMMPTPRGAEAGMNLMSATFHSRSCPVYLKLLENLDDEESGATVILIRDFPEQEWVNIPDFLQGD